MRSSEVIPNGRPISKRSWMPLRPACGRINGRLGFWALNSTQHCRTRAGKPEAPDHLVARRAARGPVQEPKNVSGMSGQHSKTLWKAAEGGRRSGLDRPSLAGLTPKPFGRPVGGVGATFPVDQRTAGATHGLE